MLSRLGSLAPTVALGLPSPPFLIASLSFSLSLFPGKLRLSCEGGSAAPFAASRTTDRRGLTFARSYTPPTTMPYRQKFFSRQAKRRGKDREMRRKKDSGVYPAPRKKSYLALPGKLRSFPSLPSPPVASQVDLGAAREKPDVTCVTDFGGKDFPRHCPAHGCPVRFRRSCVHLFLFLRSFPRRNK